MAAPVFSRFEKSLRNFSAGLGNQIVTFILNFVCRTAVIQILSVEILGINGLFTSILQVLSLAELGLGDIMLYSFYKPVAEENKKKITALIRFYRQLYNIIALVVLMIGLILLPFLQDIVKTEAPVSYLHIFYVTFLLNSVFSYLFVYKTALIKANQNLYIIKIVQTVSGILKSLLQIVVLIITKNYLLFLAINVFGTLLTNLLLGKIADRQYPYIKENETLSIPEKRHIFKNLKDMLVIKLSSVIMNYTDNILISILCGTVLVGYYSNYTMIITSVSSFITGFVYSFYSSIGNLNVKSTNEKKYEIFNIINFCFQWVGTVCTICFLFLLNRFITLWIGNSYVLSMDVVITVCLKFYIDICITPIWCYRETLGLFEKVKYVMFASAVINLVLSIILGNTMGLTGILLATCISKILTTFLIEPHILFQAAFKRGVSRYFFTQLFFIAITCLIGLVTGTLEMYLPDEGFFSFIIVCFICAVIPNIILITVLYKTKQFNYIKDRLNETIRKSIKKQWRNV